MSLLSASLASVQSRRIRATADSTAGSVSSRSSNASGMPGPDVLEHHLVEVDAAQPLQPLRPAEQPETGRPGAGRRGVALAHDGGVERAAAQVVHGDRGAGPDPLGGGVVQRGGLRLGQERDRQALRGQRARPAGPSCAIPRTPGG